MVQPINVRAINQGLRRWPINSTTNLGAGGAVDAYLVNSLSPATVADFAGVLNSGTEYYRVGGSATTFDDMFTHARSSNATMVDSDGLLKWAPHNLRTESQTFGASVWTKSGCTVTDDNAVAPDGTTTADLVTETTSSATLYNASNFASVVSGAQYTTRVWIKNSANLEWVRFILTNDGVATNAVVVWINIATNAVGANTTTGSGWSYVSASCVDSDEDFKLITITVTVGNSTFSIWVNSATADNSGTRVSSPARPTYWIWGAHLYRSDLGGMVNNWDRGDSYVSTTSAARYLPRRNHYRYNGSSFVKNGILLESAAATNLLPYSVAFDNLEWTEQNIGTIPAAATTGPDGTTSATVITCLAGTSDHIFYTTTGISATANATHTNSIYFKAGTHNYVTLGFGGTGGSRITAVFDLSAGAGPATQTEVGITSGTIVGTYLEDIGGGFYRAHISGNVNQTTLFAWVGFAESATGNTFNLTQQVVFNAAGTETFQVFGAQFEAGSVPTSYIPTSGSTATRAAETLTIAGSNMAYSATAMSFHYKGTVNATATTRYIVWGDTTIDRILLFNSAASDLTARTDSPDTDQVTVSSYFTGAVNENINAAIRITTAEFNMTTDGDAAPTPQVTTAMPDISSSVFRFGVQSGVTPTFIGTIDLFRQWDADIGDTGIEEASA